MNGIAILLSLAAVGVDYGWQPGVDGQLEYIIQIEPAQLGSLQSGREIVSEIPPEARGVRRVRVRVGTGALPRVGGVTAGTLPTRFSASDADPVESNTPNSRSTPALVRPSGSGVGAAGSTGSALTSSGILDLPPPPLLIGPDGKASVLVRPGDRALPGITPPANTYSPAGIATPGYGAGGLSAPAVLPPGGFSGGNDWQSPNTPAVSKDSLAPPPDTGSGFPTQPNSWQGGTPNGFGNPAPVYPVPGPGPETGLPSPIRSSSTKPHNQSLIEKMVAKSRTGQEPDSDTTNPLADNRSDDTAAQKPTIDEETAERLQKLQAEHPWVPLVLTSLALFGSLAANAYLGWVAVGIYNRYRDMCEQLHEAQASLA